MPTLMLLLIASLGSAVAQTKTFTESTKIGKITLWNNLLLPTFFTETFDGGAFLIRNSGYSNINSSVSSPAVSSGIAAPASPGSTTVISQFAGACIQVWSNDDNRFETAFDRWCDCTATIPNSQIPTQNGTYQAYTMVCRVDHGSSHSTPAGSQVMIGTYAYKTVSLNSL